MPVIKDQIYGSTADMIRKRHEILTERRYSFDVISLVVRSFWYQTGPSHFQISFLWKFDSCNSCFKVWREIRPLFNVNICMKEIFPYEIYTHTFSSSIQNTKVNRVKIIQQLVLLYNSKPFPLLSNKYFQCQKHHRVAGQITRFNDNRVLLMCQSMS